MADGALQVHCTCGQIGRQTEEPKVLPGLPYFADMHAQQLSASKNMSV